MPADWETVTVPHCWGHGGDSSAKVIETCTYEKEIELPPFEALSERISLARAAIGREKAAVIEAAVAALPPFLTADGQTGGIGFGQKTTGKRYTYEY